MSKTCKLMILFTIVHKNNNNYNKVTLRTLAVNARCQKQPNSNMLIRRIAVVYLLSKKKKDYFWKSGIRITVHAVNTHKWNHVFVHFSSSQNPKLCSFDKIIPKTLLQTKPKTKILIYLALLKEISAQLKIFR